MEPVTAHDLRGIVWQVWTAYLGTEPDLTPDADALLARSTECDVTASVSITGAWKGHVYIRCTHAAASAIAAAMLDVDPGSVKTEDLTDATGELMNIVAGNVKSLLPQPSIVALPQVVLGRAEVQWPGGGATCEVLAESDAEPMLVGLVHVDPGR